MRLKDISLSKTDFFLRKTATSTHTVRKIYWEYFKKIISLVEKEVGGKTHGQTDYRNLEEPPFRQGSITPILSSPWTEREGSELLRRFISRVFLDVFSLQVFLARPGEASLEDLEDVVRLLRAELSSVSDRIDDERSRQIEIPNNLLRSDCLCYWVEFADPRDIDPGADRIFEKVFGAANFRKIDFSFAAVGFIERGEDISFCILVRDLDRATVLFNDLLPEYFLSWSKVKNEESELKRKSIEEEKLKLGTLLEEKSHQKHFSLGELEKINFQLSERRTAFAEELLDMEFHLRTLEINISNAEKLLDKNLLSEQKELLRELWVKPLRLVGEQAHAYAAYYKITLEKSRIAGEKVSNDVNLKSAIYSRRLSFLFGLLSLIGILQLFPDSFGKIADYQKVIILLMTILIFLLIAFMGEIRDRFSGGKKQPPGARGD